MLDGYMKRIELENRSRLIAFLQSIIRIYDRLIGWDSFENDLGRNDYLEWMYSMGCLKIIDIQRYHQQ